MWENRVCQNDTHHKKTLFFHNEWLASNDADYLKKAKKYAKAFLRYSDTCSCQICVNEKEYMRKISLISESPRTPYSPKITKPSHKPLRRPALIHLFITEILALLFDIRVPNSIVKILMTVKNKLIGNQQIAFIGLLIVGSIFLNFSEGVAQYVPFLKHHRLLTSTKKTHLIIDITSSIGDEGNLLLSKIQNTIKRKTAEKFDLSGFNGKDLLHAKLHNTIPVDWYKEKSQYSDFLHLFPALPWDNEPIVFVSDLMHNPKTNKRESHYGSPKEALRPTDVFPRKVLDLKIFYLPRRNEIFTKKHIKFWHSYFKNVRSSSVRIYCPDRVRRGICDGSYEDGLTKLSQMHGT